MTIDNTPDTSDEEEEDISTKEDTTLSKRDDDDGSNSIQVEPMLREFPFVWLIINMAFWCLVALYVNWYLNRDSKLDEGVTTMRETWKVPCNIKALKTFLEQRNPNHEERKIDGKNAVTCVSWQELDARSWGGNAPHITMMYDRKSAYILETRLEYNRRRARKKLAFNAKELQLRFREVLVDNGVIEKAYAGMKLDEEEDSLGGGYEE